MDHKKGLIVMSVLLVLALSVTNVYADSLATTPSWAKDDLGADVLSEINVSDDVYATLSVQVPVTPNAWIDMNWTTLDINNSAQITNVFTNFEHFEIVAGSANLSLQWLNRSSSTWIELCNFAKTTTEINETCNMTSTFSYTAILDSPSTNLDYVFLNITYIPDNDGDGFPENIDCNDNNATVRPLTNNTINYIWNDALICTDTYNASIAINGSNIFVDGNNTILINEGIGGDGINNGATDYIQNISISDFNIIDFNNAIDLAGGSSLTNFLVNINVTDLTITNGEIRTAQINKTIIARNIIDTTIDFGIVSDSNRIDVKIFDNTIKSKNNGIAVLSGFLTGNNHLINNNTLEGIASAGLSGISFQSIVPNTNITNNEIHNYSLDGLFINNIGSGAILIDNNEIYNNSGNGIEVESGGTYTITGNLLYDNVDDQIELDNADGTLVRNNTILNGKGILKYGIFVSSADGCTVDNNTVTNNGRGIGITLSSNGILTNNQISQILDDGALTLSGSGFRIENNTAHDNSKNGFHITSSNSNITNNTAFNNLENGFNIVGSNAILINNTAYNNTGSGILLSSAPRIINNNIINNNGGAGINISTTQQNINITNNEIYENEYGIFSYLNQSDKTNIWNNQIYNNNGHGILVSKTENNITNNTIYNNANAGIYIVSSFIPSTIPASGDSWTEANITADWWWGWQGNETLENYTGVVQVGSYSIRMNLSGDDTGAGFPFNDFQTTIGSYLDVENITLEFYHTKQQQNGSTIDLWMDDSSSFPTKSISISINIPFNPTGLEKYSVVVNSDNFNADAGFNWNEISFIYFVTPANTTGSFSYILDGFNFINQPTISENIIINNEIYDNAEGLFIKNAFGDTINGNTIYSNTLFGINITASDNNTIYNNNFSNNGQNAIDGGTANIWNIPKQTATNIIGGESIGGNFYSEYTGTDDDGDGIGDTTFTISGSAGSIDNLPLTNVPTPPDVTGSLATILNLLPVLVAALLLVALALFIKTAELSDSTEILQIVIIGMIVIIIVYSIVRSLTT